MGAEILIGFVSIPFIVWLWNLSQLRSRKTRFIAGCLLSVGVMVTSLIVFPFKDNETFINDLTLVGVLYVPCYLVAWFLLVKVIVASRQRR